MTSSLSSQWPDAAFGGASVWSSDPSPPPLAPSVSDTELQRAGVSRLGSPGTSSNSTPNNATLALDFDAADAWDTASDGGSAPAPLSSADFRKSQAISVDHGDDQTLLSQGSRALPVADSSEVPAANEDIFVEDSFGDDVFVSGGASDDDDFGDFGDVDVTHGPTDVWDNVPVDHRPIDLSQGTAASQTAAHVGAVFSRIFPMAVQSLSSEPERQVEGLAQVLVTEESRHLFQTLTEPPTIQMLDWKRSRVRRNHLIALGVPVNLDEMTTSTARPLSTMVLPPVNASVPRTSRSGPASAPTMTGAPKPASPRLPSPIPTIDRARAAELLELTEDQLTLMPLTRLEQVRETLQALAASASAVLTSSLERREALVHDGDVLDGRIQELVSAAQRIKGPASSGSGASVKRSGSGSNMWKRNNTGGGINRAASPAGSMR